MTGLRLATCDRALPRPGDAPEWVHLLPAGDHIEARDGREYRLLDPGAIILDFQERAVDLPIDYEHQMARASAGDKGPVPAAGWIKELRHDASGLWGRVEWTATARELIARKEYRYLSPTFWHNAAGQITRLSGAGLVHKPALHLEALAQETPPMPAETPSPWSTVITRLLETLGLSKDATEREILEALDTLADRSAQSASASETPDPRRFVPIEALHDLMSERGTREATMREADAKAKVEDAFRKGHLTPAMRGWAIALCMSDPGSFDAFVSRSAAPYAHLHKTLLPNVYRSAAQPAAVSDAEEAVCAQLGLKPGRLSNV